MISPILSAGLSVLEGKQPAEVGRSRRSGRHRSAANFKRPAALYNANTKSDRDKDGVACEKR